MRKFVVRDEMEQLSQPARLAENLSNSSAEVILDVGLGQIHADFLTFGKMEIQDIPFENKAINNNI